MAVMLAFATADDFFSELPEGSMVYLADVAPDDANPPVVRATVVGILPGDTQRMWASDEKLALDDPRIADKKHLTRYNLL